MRSNDLTGMKRLLLSLVLPYLVAAPALASDAGRLPQPHPEVYVLAAQAALPAPALLPAAPNPATVLRGPLPEARAAGPLPTAQSAQLTVASIGNMLSAGSTGSATGEGQGNESLADRLPSTPVALAALALMICILVGRRNRPETI